MLHPSLFLHPEDAAALSNLEAIPGFSTAVKAFLRIGYEKLFHGLNMASKIRLSPIQLPEIYNRLASVCGKMDIETPDFYLEMNPYPNACTFGDTHIFITVTSGLLEYLDDTEINSVIAHECGHIVCRHVLYHTMASYILQGSDMLGIAGSLLAPLKYALLYWQRKSELSADRAAALVEGIDEVVDTQVRLAGGSKTLTKGINIKEWVSQADRYEAIRTGSIWDKTLQTLAVMENTHPFAAVRVKEILKWGETEQYGQLRDMLKSEWTKQACPSCKQPVKAEWAFCRRCGAKI